MKAYIAVSTFLLALWITPASACTPSGTYVSNSYASALLAGIPSITVTSENSELKLERGAITVSSQVALAAPGDGVVAITGEGVLNGRARYRVVTRGRKSFLAISQIRRDVFTNRTFINGTLISEQDLSGINFPDREVEIKCRRNQLNLIYDINNVPRTVTYTKQ